MINWLIELIKANPLLLSGLILMLSGAGLALARKVPLNIWNYIKSKFLIAIDIQSIDPLYSSILELLSDLEFARTKRGRLLSANSKYCPEGIKLCLTPAPGLHFFWYKKAPLWISKNRKEPGESKNSIIFQFETIQVKSFFWYKNQVIELFRKAELIANSIEDGKLLVFQLNKFGDWTKYNLNTPRTLESVILDDGVLENIISDVDVFLNSRKWYLEKGIPYRRGYLLWGCPGSGKTSTVQAIASHFSLKLYVLTLSSDDLSDSDLNQCLLKIPSKSLVLIEDIDSIFEGRDRTKENGSKVTFSGLLNALDGVVASDGRILIMSTNYKEKLDDALIRPGRVDYKLFIDKASIFQIKELFKRFYNQEIEKYLKKIPSFLDRKFSAAELQGVFLLNKENPQNFINHLVSSNYKTNYVSK